MAKKKHYPIIHLYLYLLLKKRVRGGEFDKDILKETIGRTIRIPGIYKEEIIKEMEEYGLINRISIQLCSLNKIYHKKMEGYHRNGYLFPIEF